MCLVWKTQNLAGSVYMLFTSLHVQAVMPVTSAKRSGIFPREVEAPSSEGAFSLSCGSRLN